MSDLCFSEVMRCIFHSTTEETTCPLVRLDNLDAVPSQLMRCDFDSKTCENLSRQLVHFTGCEKYFFTRIMSTVLDVSGNFTVNQCFKAKIIVFIDDLLFAVG